MLGDTITELFGTIVGRRSVSPVGYESVGEGEATASCLLQKCRSGTKTGELYLEKRRNQKIFAVSLPTSLARVA